MEAKLQEVYNKIKQGDKSGIADLNNQLRGKVCKYNGKMYIILNVYYVELSKPTDKGFDFIPEIGFSLKSVSCYWKKDMLGFQYPNNFGFAYDFKKLELTKMNFFEYYNTSIEVGDTVLYIENELRLNSDLKYGIVEYINEKYLIKSKYDKEPKLTLVDASNIFMKELTW